MRRTKPALDRFYEKTKEVESGCLEWTASTDDSGYGKFNVGGGSTRWERAHRWIWEQHHGPIPDGLRVRHTCDNPPCVLLAHLLIGTQAQNIQDCKQRGRYIHPESLITHCPQGHPYDEVNTYVTKTGSRKCRSCARARYHQRHAEAKAALKGRKQR